MAGRVSGRVGLGLGLMAAGLLAGLDQAGVIDIGDLWRFWPLVLVVAGLGGLWRSRGGLGPLLLLGAGILLLLHTLDWMRLRPGVIVPLGLVLLGLRLLWPRPATPEKGSDEGQDTVELNAVLGGLQHRVRSPAFRGGRVNVLLAGCDLDLTAAGCAPGGAVLDLFVFWGGIEVRVPKGWTVVLEATPLLAGIEDQTESPGAVTPGGGSRLVLRGTVLMGGVEIGN